MFWDKGFMPSQNIEALLEKENTTVEEFLDDDDILQECKTLKKPIVSYFLKPDVIQRLLELITTEPSDDLPMAQRYRHANMACEILTLGLPSLDEKILSHAGSMSTFFSYLQKEPPLNPLLASFFSKTFSMLFTKKAEQDWFLYQQTCLQLLNYIKLKNTNFLDLICKHFTTPVIPDLILQMMKDFEGGQLKRNLYEWLTEDKLVERLIAILGNPQETDKHANVAEFLCDLIQQGRTMRQTEQENDSFEPAFEGSNPILKTIESEATIDVLLNVILEPNAQESAIVSGISVVLTLIKPVVFVDEPNSDRMKYIQNREKDIHEEILTTVIRVIAPRLKDFNELLKNPPNKPDIVTTAAKLSPPFGMTRLQICRVFTVLLQTKNEDISKAICEIDYFETLLTLFKQFCWNNFLHSEVEKCLQLIFYTQLSNNNNSTQGSTIVNDGSFGKGSNNGEHNSSFFDFIFKSGSGNGEGDGGGEGTTLEGEEIAIAANKEDDDKVASDDVKKDDENTKAQNDENEAETAAAVKDESGEAAATEQPATEEENGEPEQLKKDTTSQEGEANENDTTKVPTDLGPSTLQTHVIVNCKLISKLIECWQYNKEIESAEKGRRLGYMGHLIKIFKHITNCISESEHIGALIESNFSDVSELELWQAIINPNDGEFTNALATQSKMLANCNAHDAGDYSQRLPKDFLTDNSMWDYIISPNMLNNLGAFNDSSANDIVFALEHDMYRNDLLDNDDNAENDLNLFQFGVVTTIDDDDDEEEENAAAGDGGHSLFGKSSASTSALQVFGVTNNPWDNLDPFTELKANSNTTPWATDFGSDNFADFDSHFSSFTSDLGDSLSAVAKETSGGRCKGSRDDAQRQDRNEPLVAACKEEYDNNANVEKTTAGDFVNYEDDDNAKNEKVIVQTVRSLHTVMQDSDDDLEDDEGMWTKPLGAAAQRSSEDDDEECEPTVGSAKEVRSHMLIANGPSSKQAATEEINAELHNSTEKTTTATTSATENCVVAATEAETATIGSNVTTNDKEATVMCNLTSSINTLDDAAVTDKKSAATTANTIEIATTTTT